MSILKDRVIKGIVEHARLSYNIVIKVGTGCQEDWISHLTKEDPKLNCLMVPEIASFKCDSPIFVTDARIVMRDHL